MSATRVFLSWSGELSKYVAEQFKKKLLDILRDEVDPFFSKDIRVGDRGIHVIEGALREANHAILFLTRQNRGNEWVAFESGAVGKNPENSFVCPILIDLTHAELSEPLGRFQTTSITEGSKIVEVFDRISKATGGPGLNPGHEADLKDWITELTAEIDKRITRTLEGSGNWPNTTLTRVSSDTASSPFQATDALRVARNEVVLVGQNLYSLTSDFLWKHIKNFLLRSGDYEYGVPAKDRSVKVLFMADYDDDEKRRKVVKVLGEAWGYTNVGEGDKFHINLKKAVDDWQKRVEEAKKDGFEDRLKVRLALTFIPLSQVFVDPGDGNGKLFLRPFYRGTESEKRPVVLLSEEHNREAFSFYWTTHLHLWDNNYETRPL